VLEGAAVVMESKEGNSSADSKGGGCAKGEAKDHVESKDGNAEPKADDAMIRRAVAEIYMSMQDSLDVFFRTNDFSKGDEHKLEYTVAFQEYERIIDEQLTNFADREGFSSGEEFYRAVCEAQDEDSDGTTTKMIKLLLAATNYAKFHSFMKKISGGDKAACERRAAFFKENA
jgi:hypothetical protein